MQHSGRLFQRNEDLEARPGARLAPAQQRGAPLGEDVPHHGKPDALVVAAREAVELLDGNLLCADAMPQAEVAQFGHQLPFGAFADVEFFDLFARFDRFDYGADAEYKVFRHGIGRFVS